MRLWTASVFLVPLLAATSSFAQELDWIGRYGGGSAQLVSSMSLDAEGNVIVAGSQRMHDGQWDFLVLKFDSGGDLLWSRTFDGPSHFYDYARAVAVDSAGSIIVTGETYVIDSDQDFQYTDYCTVKYDRDGNLLWYRIHHDYDMGYTIPAAVAVDGADEVTVAGSSNELGDLVAIRYGPDGNELWEARYHADNPWPMPHTLAVDTAGDVWVVASSKGIVTVRYDRLGNQLWAREYSEPDTWFATARAVVVDGNGNSYVIGELQPLYTHPVVALTPVGITMKYDPDGVMLWCHAARPWATTYYSPLDLALDAAGDLFVTGGWYGVMLTARPGGWVGDPHTGGFWTTKCSANGARQWMRKRDVTGAHSVALAIAVDNTGDSYVTGGTNFSETGMTFDDDFATVKYDTNGKELWARRYGRLDEGVSVEPRAIALDKLGDVHVAGYTGFDPNYTPACFAIKYSSLPPAAVTGGVTLENYLSPNGLVGTLEYRTPGTSEVVHSSDVTLDASGRFTDSRAPQGTYDIACKVPTWLRQMVRGVVIGPGGATADFVLPNGDADGDNAVNIRDVSVVLGMFGTQGTPPFAGDLNGDGEVDLLDVTIVLANFGMHGEP